ncbi:MAG: DUF59 domain-containing protein, partial [Acidimicrobiia bacterium]|nr:DUF59 domain-containing protein [Acidimicrobiia bacterium]
MRMASQLEANTALGELQDPELRRSLVDLGIIRSVAVDGDLAVIGIVPPLE